MASEPDLDEPGMCTCVDARFAHCDACEFASSTILPARGGFARLRVTHSMTEPRKRRWLTRLGLLFGLLIFSLLAFAIVEHFRGKAMFSRRIAELKSSGEELKVAAFLPKPVELGKNAFTILATLTTRTESILTNAAYGPPSMNFNETTRAVVAWKLARWEASDGVTNDWDWLAPQLNDAGELIAQLQAAAACPEYDCGFDYNKGFLDFQIGPLHTVKNAAQVLSAATIHELYRGNVNAAHSNLCTLAKLVVMQEPEPLVICQLVRFACATIAFNTTWQLMQSTELTQPQLAELQAIWARAQFAEDMGRALEMERAMAMTFAEQLRSSSANLEFTLNEQESVVDTVGDLLGSLPARGFVLHRIYAPFWRFAWSAQDELRSLNRWQFMIKRERFARTNSWADLASKEDPDLEVYAHLFDDGEEYKPNIYDRLRYLFSNRTFSITDVIIRKELEAQTLQRLAVTAIAIQRFRKAQAKLPSDLNALVPGYLSAVPMDPMDGKPLRFRKESESSFLLYSVGRDGKDDGGDASPAAPEKPYRQIWDGKDALWPVTEEP